MAGLVLIWGDHNKTGAPQSPGTAAAAGNKIRERPELTDNTGRSQTLQDNYLVYDHRNRLTHVYDSRVTLTHRYDQAGNRIGTSVRCRSRENLQVRRKNGHA